MVEDIERLLASDLDVGSILALAILFGTIGLSLWIWKSPNNKNVDSENNGDKLDPEQVLITINTLAATMNLNSKGVERVADEMKTSNEILSKSIDEQAKATAMSFKQHELMEQALIGIDTKIGSLASSMLTYNKTVQETDSRMVKAMTDQTEVSREMLAEMKNMKQSIQRLTTQMETMLKQGINLSPEDKQLLSDVLKEIKNMKQSIDNKTMV